MLSEVTLSCLIITAVVCGVNAHGFLWKPAGRSVSYLAGYNTAPNYNHMGLNCGGFNNQWSTHTGQCGVCGDDYGQADPRDNEAGGKYALANRTVTGSYVMGGTLRVEVNMTAYHKGFFTFKLCPNNDFSSPVTKSCLDEIVLPQIGTTDTKFDISTNESRHYEVMLQLPANLTCSQCVLQWNYTTGNSWSNWPGESGCIGCGPQETFMNCADIAILDNTSSGSSTHSASSSSTAHSTTMSVIMSSTSTSTPSSSSSATTSTTTSPTSSSTTSRSTSSTSSATTSSSTSPTSSDTTLSSTSSMSSSTDRTSSPTSPTSSTAHISTSTTPPTSSVTSSSISSTSSASTSTAPTSSSTSTTSSSFAQTFAPSSPSSSPSTSSPSGSNSMSTSNTTSSSSTSGQTCNNSCSDVENICDCVVTSTYQAIKALKYWCITNCRQGFCPPTHCSVCYCQ